MKMPPETTPVVLNASVYNSMVLEIKSLLEITRADGDELFLPQGDDAIDKEHFIGLVCLVHKAFPGKTQTRESDGMSTEYDVALRQLLPVHPQLDEILNFCTRVLLGLIM